MITRLPLYDRYAEIRYVGMFGLRTARGVRFQFIIWLYHFDLQESKGGFATRTRHKGLVLSGYYIIQTINRVLAGEVPFTGPLFFEIDKSD